MQRVFQMIFLKKGNKFQMVMSCLGVRFDKSHAGETLQNAVDLLQKSQGRTGKDQ